MPCLSPVLFTFSRGRGGSRSVSRRPVPRVPTDGYNGRVHRPGYSHVEESVSVITRVVPSTCTRTENPSLLPSNLRDLPDTRLLLRRLSRRGGLTGAPDDHRAFQDTSGEDSPDPVIEFSQEPRVLTRNTVSDSGS